MTSNLHILVLAAGKGTRMKSNQPKVLHPLCEKPILEWVLDTARQLDPATLTTVVGAGAEDVQAMFAGRTDFVIQTPQLGSGHAAAQAASLLAKQDGDLLILVGDAPLLTTDTLQRLVAHHRAAAVACTVLTAELDAPGAYGRILRDDQGRVTAIREARDASPAELAVREINSGIYVFNLCEFFTRIDRLQATNDQQEYYLTDMLEILRADGLETGAEMTSDRAEIMGINTRVDLAAAHDVIRQRINRRWMLAGVTLVDPSRTTIGPDVTLAADVVLHPDVTLQGRTTLAAGVEILPGCLLENACIEEQVRVEFSVIRDSVVRAGTTVGPFAHIRGGADIGPQNRIGNFVEVKKSVTGPGTKSAHLAYLGDATIGARVNIGAGTITCNYDGVHKHPTTIGDGAFIGSDSIIVAPLTIGDGAYVAAGSTVTVDVPAESLAVARGRQRNIEGWARKRREAQKKSPDDPHGH